MSRLVRRLVLAASAGALAVVVALPPSSAASAVLSASNPQFEWAGSTMLPAPLGCGVESSNVLCERTQLEVADTGVVTVEIFDSSESDFSVYVVQSDGGAIHPEHGNDNLVSFEAEQGDLFDVIVRSGSAVLGRYAGTASLEVPAAE